MGHDYTSDERYQTDHSGSPIIDAKDKRIAELEVIERAARTVVATYRDTDPSIQGMHPSIDNLRMALGMSAVADDR